MGWAAGPNELVGGGEGSGKGGEEVWVEDEVESGALALLGDGVGDKLEGVDFVVARGQDIEGERRDVVEVGGELGLSSGCARGGGGRGRGGAAMGAGGGGAASRERRGAQARGWEPLLGLEERRGGVGRHAGGLEGEIGPEEGEECW